MIDQFIAQHSAPAKTAAALLQAIGHPRAELDAALARIQLSRADAPDEILTPEQRDRYAGKRSPDLPRALALFLRGMTRYPDAARDLRVTPALIRQALDRDHAAERQIHVAGMLIGGADNGALIAAALLGQLTQRVLSEAHARIWDPRLPVSARTSLNAAFAEVVRLRGAEPPTPGLSADPQPLTAAQIQAEETRLLEAYRRARAARAGAPQ